MSTTMANASTISRKWYIIDADGIPLGRVATKAATILRGKHKPSFTPHADCGDHVIVLNCSKAVLTGNKLHQKKFYWHTGWIGSLKEIKYSDLMQNNPERAMSIAVKGMVPDTTLGRKQLTRLRVYRNDEHQHAAQKPEVYKY